MNKPELIHCLSASVDYYRGEAEQDIKVILDNAPEMQAIFDLLVPDESAALCAELQAIAPEGMHWLPEVNEGVKGDWVLRLVNPTWYPSLSFDREFKTYRWSRGVALQATQELLGPELYAWIERIFKATAVLNRGSALPYKVKATAYTYDKFRASQVIREFLPYGDRLLPPNTPGASRTVSNPTDEVEEFMTWVDALRAQANEYREDKRPVGDAYTRFNRGERLG